jgi:hypothetical protein
MTQYQANGLKSVIAISPATSSESTAPPIDTRRFIVMIGLRSVWIAVCMIVIPCCSRACWALGRGGDIVVSHIAGRRE